MNRDNSFQCAFCGAVNDHLRLCGACKVVRYCCTDHQHQHWKEHKHQCSKIKKSEVEHSKILSQHRSDLSIEDSTLKSFIDKSYDPLQYFNVQTSQEHDFNTAIDLDSSDNSSSRYNEPTAYQLELSPNSQTVSEELGPEWLSNVTSYLLRDLNTYGFCAVDNFFGVDRAKKVVEEVNTIHELGLLTDGQVVSRNVHDQARGMVRGDKITWVNGTEERCKTISQLVSTIDSVIANANKHTNAGKLAEFDITLRTRAMVACYPGGGTHYVKHVDNPNRDGRCVTAIYYLNENWKPQDGGILRIYPHSLGNRMAYIEPIFDRMLFFWSDRRNPHEVLPSSHTRYAITVWYLDRKERDLYRGHGKIS